MKKYKLLLLILITVLLAGLYLLLNSKNNTNNTSTNSNSISCEFDKTADSLTINFSECKKCSGTTYVGFGSTSYKFLGIQNNECVFDYGGEVENPNWNGELDTQCSLPLEVGELTFKVTNYGVDFSSISNYCK